MTVDELIAALQALPPEAHSEKVYAYHCRDCAGNEVGTPKVEDWGIVI